MQRRGNGEDRAGWAGLDELEPRVLLVFNPTAQEQLMLELLNHLRADPAANLDLMTSSLGTQARSSDPDVDGALRFFRTNGTVLARQWAALVAVPPLAWNEDLYEASEAHTRAMIAADEQTHQAPGEPDLGDRATAAGYNFASLGENVYAFADSVFHGHAGFAIDWGNDADGLQVPPGHRDNMLNRTFREVGIRVLSENVSSTQVGPLVITQDLGTRQRFGDSFLLGVASSDSDGDKFYDVGEGLGGVTIQAVGAAGTFTTTSMAAGGYQLALPFGVYDVTFSGGSFGSAVTHRNVAIGGDNVKVDGLKGERPPAPEIAIVGNAIEIVSGDITPTTGDWTDFGQVNLAQTLTRVFTIRNTGLAALELSGAVRVSLTGAGSFRLVSDAGAIVPAGGQTTFAVQFVPTDTRVATATVTVVSDDSDEPMYTVRLRARGLNAPDAVVAGGNGVAIIDGDTTAVASDGTAFGGMNIVSRMRTRLYTIRNTGSTTLQLTGGGGVFVGLRGPQAGDFEVVSQPTGTLLPGQSTGFRIRFNPSALGARTATVRIATNIAGVPVYDFVVSGNGFAAPIVQVLGNGVDVAAGSQPSDGTGTQFGTVSADVGGVARTFTIVNVGSARLTFNAVKRLRVVVGGAAIHSYVLTQRPPLTLGVGQSAQFRVRFDPPSTGDKFARIIIDTVNAGSFSFNVAGMAV